MTATKERIESFVRDQYPRGFESGLEERGRRIFGYVRSDDFATDYAERLRAFRKKLTERFGQHMLNVGIIVPLVLGESLDRR